MTFKINGVDFSDCIIAEGLIFTEQDVLSGNSQRSQYSGAYYYKITRSIYTGTIITQPLPRARFDKLLSALVNDRQPVEITWTQGSFDISRTFKVGDRPASPLTDDYVDSTTYTVEEV